MAEYTQNINLEKPAGSDNFRRQVINDNMDKLDSEIGLLRAKIQTGVIDLAALKGINTAAMPDKTLILVEALGLYRFDSGSTAAAEDNLIVQPTAGGGRWIKMTEVSIAYGVNTSANDSYTAVVPGIGAYYSGLCITFKATIANTTACSLNINSLGAKTIKKNISVDLETGDILANQIVNVVYDGTNFQMMSVPGGTVTSSGAATLNNKTLTAPKMTSGSYIADSGGNELIKFPSTVASAVNEITVSNAVAGSAPQIQASGGDVNIDLNLVPKGTGALKANGVQVMLHSLATAANDFLVASGAGLFVKKTLAEVKAILGLGTAAYTNSTDYETPAGAQAKADGVQTNLTMHSAENMAHGAVSAAAANKIILRDATGRAKVAAPSASDDIARLDSITKVQVGLGSVDNYATATQSEAEAGAVSNKFMTPQRTKQYVDTKLENGLEFRLNAGVLEYWNGSGWIAMKSGKDYTPFSLYGGIAVTTAWTELLNISGKGVLNKAVVASQSSISSKIRITIDGTVRYLLASAATTGRGVGFVTEEVIINGIATLIGPNTSVGIATEATFVGLSAGDITDSSAKFVVSSFPLPFNTNLKIEISVTSSVSCNYGVEGGVEV